MDVLPSMPKGVTVGNVVIDGKGDGKGGAPEIATRQQRGTRGRKREQQS